MVQRLPDDAFGFDETASQLVRFGGYAEIGDLGKSPNMLKQPVAEIRLRYRCDQFRNRVAQHMG